MTDAPLLDSMGRPRSPATLPGFRAGKSPRNKGRKLPAETLTPREIRSLLDSMSTVSRIGRRNRALVWLMYRANLKIGQALSLERSQYVVDTGELVFPATARKVEKRIRLDESALGLLDEWMKARREIGIRPIDPLFCTVSGAYKGSQLGSPYVRTMLVKTAQKAGIEKRVTPEGIRRSGAAFHDREAHEMVREMAAYIDDDGFRAHFADAHAKWSAAHALLLSRSDATTIGYHCREAMQAFALSLAVSAGVEVEKTAPTTPNIEAVLARRTDVSKTVRDQLRALYKYWETVDRLAQRQVHAAQRERERLSPDDGRRLVFHTMLVMFELAAALGPARFAP